MNAMRVIRARASGRYRLELTFDDGEHGLVDLADLAGVGVFKGWEGGGSFENLEIGTMGEVAWACGVDLCPDSLYMRLTGKNAEELFPQSTGRERCA